MGETFIDPMEVLPGIPSAVLEDDAVADLVNKVQMQNAGAGVSLTALFDATSNLQAGPFLHRDSVKIYKYGNTLYGVKVTGKQMKAIMEQQAGGFFNQYQPGDATISFNPNIRLYSYDMFAGSDYEIDVSKPAGSRIQNVIYKGHPLTDGEAMILALNNYRYGGLVSAGLINEAGDCLWSIAQRACGTGAKWGAIYSANKAAAKDPALIRVGQVLAIPAA